MNWYTGNITQAVKLSQEKNSIFVVYVEGNDDLSARMAKFINEDPRIKNHLQSENFVAIRIETGSESYMQFAQIYKLVPSPSMFFINRNGEPLEIVTGIIESADDLVKKIENVLQMSQKVSSAIPPPNAIYGEASNSAEAIDNTNISNTNTDNASENPEMDHITMLEKARKIIEKKRKDKEAEEEKLQKEKEIERRKLGKNMQSFKEKQKDEELQKLKEERIRDRLEEQIARQRIVEKIASDRAERAYKFSAPSNTTETLKTKKSVENIQSNSDTSRIQFRTPDGQINTHVFNIKDEFQIIRNYVANTILEQSITDFQLATTFPKREFATSEDSKTISELGLYPSALILIFYNLKDCSKQSTVARLSGQILTVFMTALSPIFMVFGYFRRLFMGNNSNDNASQQQQSSFGTGFATGSKSVDEGAQRSTNNDQASPNDEAKKRNINRLISGGIINDGGSTSNNSKTASNSVYRRSNVHRIKDLNDSDDENATWNGNSTQQQ